MRALFSFGSWDASTRALLADSRESFGRIRAVLRLLLNEGHPRVWRLRLLVKTGLRCLSLAKRRKEVVTSFSSLLSVRVGRICSIVIETSGLEQVTHPSDAFHELSQALGISWMKTIPRLK